MSSGNSNELEGELIRTHDDTRRFKFLRISNLERTNGTPWDFNVALGNDIRLDHAIELHLMNVSIPNIGNNVSGDIGNNVVAITFSGQGPLSFVIPDGYYTTAQLMTYILGQ